MFRGLTTHEQRWDDGFGLCRTSSYVLLYADCYPFRWYIKADRARMWAIVANCFFLFSELPIFHIVHIHLFHPQSHLCLTHTNHDFR
jgi:hypothetical protein